MSLVKLRSFENPTDAHLLRSKLESEGINALVFDENVVGVLPIHSLAVGGVRVMVLEEHLKEAEEVASQFENAAYKDDSGEVRTCSECGSSNLFQGKTLRNTKGILSAILTVLFTSYPMYDPVYRCKDCGNTMAH